VNTSEKIPISAAHSAIVHVKVMRLCTTRSATTPMMTPTAPSRKRSHRAGSCEKPRSAMTIRIRPSMIAKTENATRRKVATAGCESAKMPSAIARIPRSAIPVRSRAS
jgi:hypothetical protein